MNSNYKRHDGFWWPAQDIHCRAVIAKEVDNFRQTLQFAKDHRTAIQAGGNVGHVAKFLASQFNYVITAEPDEMNFDCLIANLEDVPNTLEMNVALGDENRKVTMCIDPKNCGAGFINLTDTAAAITMKMITIDSFAAQLNVDFIALDIEGYEFPALKGAAETIDRCRPAIQIEDKGLSEKYGYAKGDAVRWLADKFGYSVKMEIGRDFVLTCG